MSIFSSIGSGLKVIGTEIGGILEQAGDAAIEELEIGAKNRAAEFINDLLETPAGQKVEKEVLRPAFQSRFLESITPILFIGGIVWLLLRK